MTSLTYGDVIEERLRELLLDRRHVSLRQVGPDQPHTAVDVEAHAACTATHTQTPHLSALAFPNPPLPGDTMAVGSAMSKAATFPMANPYPECTSGSPID